MNEKILRIIKIQNNAILQRSLSAELHEKVEQINDLERNLRDLLLSMEENLSDFDQKRDEFAQKEADFFYQKSRLRAIIESALLMN